MITYTDLIFEKFWDKTVPLPFRLSRDLKEKARVAWNSSLEEFSKYAVGPEIVSPMVAFLKIGRILKESRLILEDNPDPESVVTAVKALIDRLKLSPQDPAQ